MSDDQDGWFEKAIQANIDRTKTNGHEASQPITRIVSYSVYAEAKKAEEDGANPRQIAMCLAGASWAWVKENAP